MHPLLGFPLSHAEEASLDALEAVCRQVCEEEEQAIFWRGERAVLVDGKLARRPGFAIEAPRGHMRLKRRLKGRDELLKLVECQTRQIQELCRAGLHVGALDIAHLWYLLSWEAQYIINRDKLKWSVCP